MTYDEKRDRELRERLAEIRASYISTLRSQGTALSQLMARRDNVRDSEIQQRVLALVHKLGGTAGSFGLEEIAVPAAALELALMAADRLSDCDAAIRDLIHRLDTIQDE